jgi:putative DNA primase/helicase
MDLNAGVIAEWLDRPVSLSDLDSADPQFEDLDATIKVLRSETCLLQIWQQCLEEHRRPNRADSLMLGKAMRHIGGWEVSKQSEWFGKFGKQKVWRRSRNGT